MGGLYIPASEDLNILPHLHGIQKTSSLNLSGAFQPMQQHKAVESLERTFSLYSKQPYSCPLQYIWGLISVGFHMPPHLWSAKKPSLVPSFLFSCPKALQIIYFANPPFTSHWNSIIYLWLSCEDSGFCEKRRDREYALKKDAVSSLTSGWLFKRLYELSHCQD